MQMTIYDMGIANGNENGIKVLIELCCEFALSKDEIIGRLMEKFKLDESLALEYYEKHTKLSVAGYDK